MKAIGQFCSFVFVPQWGSKGSSLRSSKLRQNLNHKLFKLMVNRQHCRKAAVPSCMFQDSCNDAGKTLANAI